jgi:hypothetical protein
MPLSGERVQGRRAREALERGGTLPEGATGPRARRNFTRGATNPRARQRFAGAVLSPSSEAEFCPRVAGPTVLVGRWDHQCRGPSCWAVVYLKHLCLFCVLFF